NIRLFEVGGTDDPDRQHHGFNHVAFEPEGDVQTLDLLEARLQSHGAEIEGWEGHAEGRHKSLYFYDPDGNRLEFYWENPSWREESRQKVGKAFNR
ncbi:MAG TPA: hypothetical protein DF282_04625, partial [Hyphomonas sp.]|nr:hypothetical protein [Hyphomonas sp.]